MFEDSTFESTGRIKTRSRRWMIASEPAIATTALNMDQGTGVPEAGENPFGRGKPTTVVHSAETGRVRVSSGVVDGLAIYKSVPPYPAIARAARVQGTVILQATISKSGTIENLRVISGPAMLQQAAIDSVRNWRYRPYMLNGQPVEVETTVNVVFTLAQ